MDEKKLQEMMDEITNGKDYDKEQMLQIQYGIEDGLTKEQIQFYADSKFSDLQMEEIRWGFEDGLTMKQVQTYAKPEFDSEQMRQIRGGLESKLTMKQVSIYTNSEFNEDQMYEIRCGLEHGLTMEQVQTYAKPEFDSEQMLEMREEAESHLSEITIHYKGELGEFDYNISDYVLLQDREGKDYLHYNDEIGNTIINLPKGITSTRHMFDGCYLPDDFKFGDFDTSEVTDMSSMFENCSIPDEFTFGNEFDTRNVKDMSCMFNGCSMPEDFVFNDKFVINDDCIVENMFEDSNIDDLSPLEEPNLEAEGEEL